MAQNLINNDLHVNGTLSAKRANLPASSIGDSEIEQNAGIKATKLIHQHALNHQQADGADVVSETVPLHIFRSAAEIVAVEVVAINAPDGGGDKQFTVDVQAGNQSTAFTTILSAVITVDDNISDREVVAGTVTTTTAADGDSLQVVVTASGSSGNQAQGLLVTVWIREEP